jgi:hypothetical protein
MALLAHIKGGTTKNNKVEGRIGAGETGGSSRQTACDATKNRQNFNQI